MRRWIIYKIVLLIKLAKLHTPVEACLILINSCLTSLTSARRLRSLWCKCGSPPCTHEHIHYPRARPFRFGRMEIRRPWGRSESLSDSGLFGTRTSSYLSTKNTNGQGPNKHRIWKKNANSKLCPQRTHQRQQSETEAMLKLNLRTSVPTSSPYEVWGQK